MRSSKLHSTPPWLDHGISYEVSPLRPYFEFAPNAANTTAQLHRDGIEPEEVVTFLRNWCKSEPAVKHVVLDYRARRYSLGIVPQTLTADSMTELQLSVDPIRLIFGRQEVVVSILPPDYCPESGPSCLVFGSPDCVGVAEFH